MKTFLRGLMSLFLALAVTNAPAQMVVNQFNAASEAAQWRFDFGGVTGAPQFDPTMDAGGNAASGSLKFTFMFNTNLAGENKSAYARDFTSPVNGTQLSRLQMDVRVDSSSAKDAFGNYGFFQVVVRNGANFDYNGLFGDNLTTSNTWRHIDTPLTGAIDSIRAVEFQLYGGPNQNINGNYVMWIDNVLFTQPPATSPPPRIVFGRLIPGLGIDTPPGDRS